MSEPTRVGYVLTDAPEGAEFYGAGSFAERHTRESATLALHARPAKVTSGHVEQYFICEVLEYPGEERIIARAEGEEVPEGAVRMRSINSWAGPNNYMAITFYRLTTPARRVLGKVV